MPEVNLELINRLRESVRSLANDLNTPLAERPICWDLLLAVLDDHAAIYEARIKEVRR